MAPQKKASLQIVAPSAAFKGKKIATGGTGDADHHPQNPNIIQLVEEEHSSSTITPERTADEHESRLPVEGQFL